VSWYVDDFLSGLVLWIKQEFGIGKTGNFALQLTLRTYDNVFAIIIIMIAHVFIENQKLD